MKTATRSALLHTCLHAAKRCGVVASCAMVLVGCKSETPLPPNAMIVRYEVHGAVEDLQILTAPADRNHYCSTATLPWGHTPSGAEIPPGPPNFTLDFDLRADGRKPGLYFMAFGYHLGMTSQTDPADDWIEVNAGGKQWVAHGLQRDPSFNATFTFSDDGQSGSFIAHGLHPGPLEAPVDMKSSVQVSGTWTCASVAN